MSDMQVEAYVMAAKRDIAEGHGELPDKSSIYWISPFVMFN